MTTQFDAARQSAAAAWRVPPDKVFPLDISARFPWARRHAFFLVQDIDRRSLLVCIGPDGAVIPANDRMDPAAVNRLLQEEGVALPGVMSAEQLAWLVRSLLVGPGGFVGSQAFLDREKGALASWTPVGTKDGPALFRKYCEDPRIERQGEDWTLHFFYFNNMGGVEIWKLSGDPRSVRNASSEIAVPNRTFSFPYG